MFWAAASFESSEVVVPILRARLRRARPPPHKAPADTQACPEAQGTLGEPEPPYLKLDPIEAPGIADGSDSIGWKSNITSYLYFLTQYSIDNEL